MNPSTERARLLVDELVALGVTEAVLCPGSRNAPLSFALHAADRAGRLRLHVRIDERTAAFLALGLAWSSRRPVPVVCTSGTAAANLHPAVLEASYAGIPLLAVTADRPPELVGTGASQTIVQRGLFGSAPRLEVSFGSHGVDGGLAPGAEGPADWRSGWRVSVRGAVAAALGRGADGGGGPGPVHLNVPFSDPLVPDDHEFAGDPVEPGEPVEPPQVADDQLGQAEPLPLDPDASTLVIGGGVPVGVTTGSIAEAMARAVTAGVPVVAEPSSPLWPGALHAGPWLLDGGDGPERPEQVVLHGRPTLHRSVTRLIADPSVRVFGVAGTNVAGWPRSVRAVGSLPPLNPPPGWRERWVAADKVAVAALDEALPHAPVGLRLAAALVAALPDGAQLTLGSSNPVRDVALAARPRQGLSVLANRGVAGIDGTVSTAAGAALAHRRAGGGPGYALLGDLTLLHDTTGLVLGPDEPRPDLTIVVLNDVGGGIFSLLEQGAPEHAADFERVFGTPHRVRLDGLCASLGVEHRLVTDLAELPSVLAPGRGIRVIEVPAERAGLRDGHAELRAAVQGR